MNATHRITEPERDVLSKAIPLHHLLPMAGMDRLTPMLIERPALLDIELKRRALTRLKAGEFCLLTPPTVPGLDIQTFFNRHSED
jgi:hypothetical protein